MTTKGSIYVGNLPKTFTDDELRQLFESVGSIESVVVKEGKSKDGSQRFNYGFVNFEDNASVDAAISTASGKVIQGRILTVRQSEKSKSTKSGGRVNQNQHQNGDSHSAPSSRVAEDSKKLQGYEEVVTITYVVDPHTLYAQAINQEALGNFSTIMNNLQVQCTEAQPLNGLIPDKNKMYGAIFEEDGGWYRCQVKNYNNQKAEVHYIDYGNSAEVEMSTLVPLSDELSKIRPLAQKIRVIGVAPQLLDSSSDAAKQAFAYLSGIDEDGGASKSIKVIFVKGTEILEDGSLPGQLFKHGDNVAESINKKFAPEYQQKLEQVAKIGNQIRSAGRQRGKENQGAGDSSGSHSESRQSQNNEELLTKIQNLETELEQMRGRLDPRHHRSHDSTGKVKNLENIIEQLRDEKMLLQTQMASLKRQMEEDVDRANKKMKSALESRLSPLTESFHRLKEARNSFIIDPNHKNTIQLAIELAANRLSPFAEGSPTKEKGDLISLIPDSAPVGARLQELETVQQTIQGLESKDELPEIMLIRNDARHEAYKALTTFLDDVKKLPIAKRLRDIETMVSQLQSEYSSYLDPSNVMQPEGGKADVECFEEYKLWLEERCDELLPQRKVTDDLRARWCDLLKAIHESFQYGASPAPNLDSIDALRDELLVAMETEITLTVQGYMPAIQLLNSSFLKIKQEQDVREMEIISSTVQALVSALVGEKQTLTSLNHLCDNFSLTADQLNPWLNARPDVTDLQTVMREIKTLRSKLRHKLADRHDMEEDPELEDETALSQLQDEIHSIQEKLWGFYQEESKLLRELADLTTNHFPELPCIYPTFGITKFLESNGLVREGRDLKHFDLNPVQGCEKTTVKLASVNSKPVAIIKIIHLPEKNTLDKMVAYSAYSVPHCMTLDTVYQAADNSQLFLQLPYMNMGNLEAALATQDTLSKADIINVCRDILEALSGLHRLGLVHGGVHPRNILLHKTEGTEGQQATITAKLAEFDFTKTTSETALKGYTASNKLKFTAPEVNCGLQAASQADIFSAGILLLWALFPTKEFTMKADGIPDLNNGHLHPSLVEVLTEMLNYSPIKRPAAARVLEFQFFVDPPEFVEEEEIVEEVVGDGGAEGSGEMQKRDVLEQTGEDEVNPATAVGAKEVEGVKENQKETVTPATAVQNQTEEDQKKSKVDQAQAVKQDQPEGEQTQVALLDQAEVDQEPAVVVEESVQELTVTQGSPSKDGNDDKVAADAASECDSEPPPLLEDDELVELEVQKGIEEPGAVSDKCRDGGAEIDDNSSPV